MSVWCGLTVSLCQRSTVDALAITGAIVVSQLFWGSGALEILSRSDRQKPLLNVCLWCWVRCASPGSDSSGVKDGNMLRL